MSLTILFLFVDLWVLIHWTCYVFLSCVAYLDFLLAYLSSDTKPGSGLWHLRVFLLLAAPLTQEELTIHLWNRSSLLLWLPSSLYS